MSNAIIRVLALFLLLAAAQAPVWSENNYLQLGVSPEGSLPLGPLRENYGPGIGGSFAAGLELDAISWLVPEIEIGPGLVPLTGDATLNLISAGIGASITPARLTLEQDPRSTESARRRTLYS